MWLILLLALVGLIFLAILAVFGISAWVAHTMTTVYRIPVYGHPTQFGLDYEDVEFPSRHDKISLLGWYLPAASDNRCIILIPGQGHHRNSPGIKALQLGRDLVEKGFSVLLFDFRGRGESGGNRESAGDREQWDVFGALDYVTGRGIPLERIGLIGFSIGAGVAILVAEKEPRIPALVSDSGWLDTMPDLQEAPFLRFTLPSWFAFPIVLMGRLFFGADFSKSRPIKAVGKVSQPIMFIHGNRDRIIDYKETEQLYEASGNENDILWIVPGADHIVSYARQPKEYVKRVSEFFNRYIRTL